MYIVSFSDDGGFDPDSFENFIFSDEKFEELKKDLEDMKVTMCWNSGEYISCDEKIPDIEEGSTYSLMVLTDKKSTPESYLCGLPMFVKLERIKENRFSWDSFKKDFRRRGLRDLKRELEKKPEPGCQDVFLEDVLNNVEKYLKPISVLKKEVDLNNFEKTIQQLRELVDKEIEKNVFGF